MSVPIHVFGVTGVPNTKLVLALYMPYGMTTPTGLTVSGGAYLTDEMPVSDGDAFIPIGMVQTLTGSGSYDCVATIDGELPDSPANYPYTVAVREVPSDTDLTSYSQCRIQYNLAANAVRAERQVPDTFMGGMLRNGVWGGTVTGGTVTTSNPYRLVQPAVPRIVNPVQS